MFRGRRKEFEEPGGQTCGETRNHIVGIQHYAQFSWQAWDKSEIITVETCQKNLYELQKNPLATSSADVLLSQGLKREYVAVL